ncbi:unnamed protein product, partial [Discosporangium mesarthrocarpum]
TGNQLGFDIQQRRFDSGMTCLQVTAVLPGGLAEKHGLQAGDLVLGMDGAVTLGAQVQKFWEAVAARLGRYQHHRKQQQQQQQPKAGGRG